MKGVERGRTAMRKRRLGNALLLCLLHAAEGPAFPAHKLEDRKAHVGVGVGAGKPGNGRA